MDNNTYIDQYYLGEPAFSVYIEDGAEKILFDTGYSDAFLRNAEQMRVDMNALTLLAAGRIATQKAAKNDQFWAN